MEQTRESMQTEVLIIGAGPAGLATAIHLAQLAKAQQKELSITILEKGAAVGSHILAGAVLEPRSLNELIPNWQELGAPIMTKAQQDSFLFLTEQRSFKLPTPPQMHNEGNYIISLSQLCRWLATQAENLGVQIFPGFAATEVLYDENQRVIGVATGDAGISKAGVKKPNYQPGINLLAKYTVCAEGSRGSITKTIINTFDLQKNSDPQTYGLGIKELWEVPSAQHKPGTVIHTIGWPLDQATYGGSFIYHLDPNIIALGFVVGLDYSNPYLSPYDEMQRFKLHPTIKAMLQNGRCIEYGARVINEGGLQSIPQLYFPGGLLVGCAAGFLNVPKIKGIHTAIKSGMLAAESIYAALGLPEPPAELTSYTAAIEASWIWPELKSVRNIRPGFKHGLWFGLANAALDTYILRGKAPWTMHNHADYNQLKLAANCAPINYPKYDGKITFDKMTSVQRSHTNHEEDQPPHLQLKDPTIPITVNLAKYQAPEQRYCPAGVYEIIQTANRDPYLQINAQNCVHCKACDVKDPTQNITWVPPEGGGGPNYSNM
jgi:electron-transferring-flavoprotein dehydrogenase